jgi:hypothetical protein
MSEESRDPSGRMYGYIHRLVRADPWVRKHLTGTGRSDKRVYVTLDHKGQRLGAIVEGILWWEPLTKSHGREIADRLLRELKAKAEASSKRRPDGWLPVPELGIELARGWWVRHTGGGASISCSWLVPQQHYTASVEEALERGWARPETKRRTEGAAVGKANRGDPTAGMIWLRRVDAIADGVFTTPQDGPFAFHIRDPDFPEGVKVMIDAPGEHIESEAKVPATESLVRALQSAKELSKPMAARLLSRMLGLRKTSMWVLRLIEQELTQGIPASNPLKDVADGDLWSLNGSDWRRLPDLWPGGGIGAPRSLGALDRGEHRRIQALLNAGEKPLVAMEHLYEASRIEQRGEEYEPEQLTRFRWIETATAAELAIKEVLLRIRPALTPLLLHVPSPPVHTLYGKVLEEVAGEASPYVAELQEAARIRNELIHKPGAREPDAEKATQYMETVNEAIKHLLDLHRRLRERGLQNEVPGPPV